MTNPNRTHITAVIDRSGSMASLTSDTIGGFNKFISDQRSAPGEATITLVLFNGNYEVVYDARPVKEVEDLNPSVYRANGNTALYDALGKAIQTTGASLSALPEENRPGTVIVLVITDGEENTSREFAGEAGRQKVQTMVQHQTDTYKWTFVFMGANIDARAVGTSLGVAAVNTRNYAANSMGVAASYESISRGVISRRKSPSSNADFFDTPDTVLGKD